METALDRGADLRLQRNCCSRIETGELDDEIGRVLRQRSDTPATKIGAGDGNRSHTGGASEPLKQAVWCDCGFQV
jgi:hypothetical protein